MERIVSEAPNYWDEREGKLRYVDRVGFETEKRREVDSIKKENVVKVLKKKKKFEKVV